MIVQFRLRRGSAVEWLSTNPVLGPGEPGLETPTQRMKIGDGVTAWVDLPYATYSARDLDTMFADLGLPDRVRKSVASTNPSTAYQSDPVLTRPMLAFSTYEVVGLFVYGGASGIKFAFDLPAGSTADFSLIGLNGALTGGNFFYDNETMSRALGTFGVGVKMAGRLSGFITTAATPGNAALKWAQNGTSLTPVTVYEGSHLLVRKVA